MRTRASPAILVVEDERIIARDLQQTLAQLGYDAYAVASSADEALMLAAERRPDVVLMDIRIQGDLDGVEAASILQTRFDVPVVYLTAHADEAILARAKQTGPYGYLLKPVRPAELRSIIEVSLYKHGIEQQLRERERWLSTTLRSIGDGVIAVDPAGCVVDMNPVAEMLTGSSLLAARGKPSREVLRPVDVAGEAIRETPLDRVLRTLEPVRAVELGLAGATGKVMIADSVSPVMDGPKVLGAVMVLRDITEQRHVERQLRESQRLAALGTMAAGMAHEVANPLAVVMTNAGFLDEDLRRRGWIGDATDDTDRANESLHAVTDLRSAANRIGRIVQDLREYSRPPAPTSGRANLSRAVEWAVRATSREFSHRAHVIIQVPELPEVAADEARIGQLLVNLLLNAAQSIAPGNLDHNEVRLEAVLENPGYVTLKVADTGCGIAEGEVDHIFEPFYTTKAAGMGMGLGLSICKGIVNAIGGQIDLVSNVGVGSTFAVRLPIAPVMTTTATIEDPPAPVARRASILVIDDDPLILNTFRRALPEHDIVCTEHAGDVLDWLANGREFDLILCDLMMPRVSGMEFYGSLLLLRPQDAERILFVTGGATTPEVREFLDSVSNRRIEKPFDALTLQQIVQQQLVESGDRLVTRAREGAPYERHNFAPKAAGC